MHGMKRLAFLVMLAIGLLTAHSAVAQSIYTWQGPQTTGSYTWETPADWNPNSNYPGNLAGDFDTAIIGTSSSMPAGTVTINFTSANLYLNTIDFNQTGAATNGYVISSTGGGVINFGGSTPAAINVNGGTQTISAATALRLRRQQSG